MLSIIQGLNFNLMIEITEGSIHSILSLNGNIETFYFQIIFFRDLKNTINAEQQNMKSNL